jgi:hypothetical protein
VHASMDAHCHYYVYDHRSPAVADTAWPYPDAGNVWLATTVICQRSVPRALPPTIFFGWFRSSEGFGVAAAVSCRTGLSVQWAGGSSLHL